MNVVVCFPRVRASRAKRKTKVLSSIYRDSKSFGHTTVNGLGLIGRLRNPQRREKQ